MSPDPYALTKHDGRTVDEITHQALLQAEKRLGYELSITQGSYNAGGVSASAGTHDGGGVVDLAPFDQARKVRVLRDLGFAAWYRPRSASWSPHIHAVLIGNRKLSPSAARQVESYKRGRDGLAGDNVDPNGYRPSPIPTFQWPPPPTNVGRVRAALLAALNSDAARSIPTRRVFVHTLLRTIRTATNRLPER